MILNPIIPIIFLLLLGVVLVIIIFMSSKGIKLVNRILMLIVISIIALRPMIPNGEVEVKNSNFDVFFIVDNSISMDALDYNGENKRLVGVKEDIKHIITELPGANYALLSYNYDSKIRVPLTFDVNTVLASAKAINPPNLYNAKGSKLTGFKSELELLLKNSEKNVGRKKIVFLFTDGENTTEDKLESLRSLKSLIDDGAVLGYGTQKGGYILHETYDGKMERIQDKRKFPYVDVLSKLDESNLKNMAHDMGVDYIYMNKTSNIDNKIKDINKSMMSTDSKKIKQYKDIYYYFTPILLVLFSIELFIDRRNQV